MSSYERHKICMDCEDVKPISEFPYGFGSYRKSDRCRDCSSSKKKFWNFGGSIRAIGKSNRVCKSSTYFDKKLPNLSKLNDQVRRINGRDYKVTESEN